MEPRRQSLISKSPQAKPEEHEQAKSRKQDDEEEEVEEGEPRRGRQRAESDGTVQSRSFKAASRSTRSTWGSLPTRSNTDPRPTQSGSDSQPVKNAAPGSRNIATSSDLRPTKALPPCKSKPPNPSASNISSGEWQGHPSSSPRERKRTAMAKDVVHRSSSGHTSSRMSCLIKLAESSPSLGCGRALDLPMMREKKIGAAEVSARSDAGATHIGEGERARRWNMIRAGSMPYEEPPKYAFVNRVALEGDNA